MPKECPICLIELENKFSVNTPCNHIICLECFVNLINNECPLCRKLFRKKPVSIIKQKFKDDFKLNENDFPPL